ncbi:MAG: DUF6377 domain-containing protein [Bacteroidales bacterium]|nr:DUF6377 domain-containing protein [Bacteroidales bacterium]
MKNSTTSARIVVLLAVIICSILSSSAAGPRSLREALDTLDRAIITRRDAHTRRHHLIDSLKQRYNEHRHPLRSRAVADAYRQLNIDSAIIYYQTTIELADAAGDTTAVKEALIEYAGQLGKSGNFSDALSTLDTISPATLTGPDRLRYYDLLSQIYIDRLNSTQFKGHRKQLTAKLLTSLDSLKTMLPPRSIGRRMTNAICHNISGDSVLAEGEIKEFFDSIPLNHPLYGIASGLMAEFYRNRPDKADEYLYYLALASASDARVACNEAYTLELLGSEMFKRGDFNRAYDYLTVAGEAIYELGARKRFTYDAPPLAILLDSMRQRERRQHTSFIVTLCLLGAVIVTFISTMVRVARRSRQQQDLCRKAYATSAAKDKYISQLLELCSSLFDSMEELNRLVGRKIMANQTRDLYQDVESGKILRRQAEKFFSVFDESVFNIYPDFVNDINALLQPDKRIILTEPGVLTPELRIAAFMRLGVNDSNRIAKFLGLSLNTVYTYRNRMKSRALRRDTFESDILKMGDIS